MHIYQYLENGHIINVLSANEVYDFSLLGYYLQGKKTQTKLNDSNNKRQTFIKICICGRLEEPNTVQRFQKSTGQSFKTAL